VADEPKEEARDPKAQTDAECIPSRYQTSLKQS
jgi:hypothetical protein